MTFDTLLVDIADGIATITLNRPKKKNAMNPALHRDMTSALDQLRYEPTARVVLITGAGDAFCGGMDLKEYFTDLKDSPAEYDRVFNVNVRGVFLTAQAVLRSVTARNKLGNILITASIAGLQGSPMTSIYNSSKFAAIGIARSLALEVGSQGIRVNVLAPGAVKSRMMSALEESIGAASGVSADDIRTGIEAATGLGRYATPTEIASTAAWVLSDEVPYCHGEVFTVGGGIRTLEDA